jgi:hypothetical protein
VRAHIRTFYDDLIDTNVVISGGEADLPRGAGLGTRLNPDLFRPERRNYRITRLEG